LEELDNYFGDTNIASLISRNQMENLGDAVALVTDEATRGKLVGLERATGKNHETYGRFFANSDWDDEAVSLRARERALARTRDASKKSRRPVVYVLDDTTVQKNKPSSGAKRPTEAVDLHHLGLLGKVVHGHQAEFVLASCGNVCAAVDFYVYDKDEESKIAHAVNVTQSLPRYAKERIF
jgi:SRSO17 transposase